MYEELKGLKSQNLMQPSPEKRRESNLALDAKSNNLKNEII